MSFSVQKVIFPGVTALCLFFCSSLQAMAWQPPLRTVPKTELTDVAVAGSDGDEPVIFFNPQYMQRLGPVIGSFFFAHEYAHHRLGHLRKLAEVMKKDRRRMIQIRQEYEMEADCYAASLLAKDAPQAVEAAITFFETAQRQRRLDWLHPSGYQRAGLIRQCFRRALSKDKAGGQDLPPGDRAALKTVILSPPELLRDSRNKQLLFSYRIKNTGRRPVRCSVLIRTSSGEEVRRFDRELAPGDVRSLNGSLREAGNSLSERISCQFSGPVVPGPERVSASDFLSFAGISSGDDVAAVARRFGTVMPRPGNDLWYLDYFNGGMSVGCNRITKKIKSVDVVGIEGAEALRGLGISDPRLSLIGKSREYIREITGNLSRPDDPPSEYTISSDGVTVTFFCYREECDRMTVRWK